MIATLTLFGKGMSAAFPVDHYRTQLESCSDSLYRLTEQRDDCSKYHRSGESDACIRGIR